MTKIDLSNVTIVISLKPDSSSRLRNLKLTCSYYQTFATNAEIIVVEQDSKPQITPDPATGLRVHAVPDDGFHWKTRNMNLGAALSLRPLLLMSDSDVFPHPKALDQGLEKLRNASAFVSLYNGIVVNLSESLTSTLGNWPDFVAGLRHYEPADVTSDRLQDLDMAPLYGNADHLAVGGCFLCHRADFFGVGGWNPNIVSYGAEDQEFFIRAGRLGHPFQHIKGRNLYHFDHARGLESRYGAFYRQNMGELDRVRAMGPTALAAYAARGFRSLAFEDGYDYARFSTDNADGWHRVPDTKTDLSDLICLVIADPAIVGRKASCIEPLLDHLEGTYRGYDLRICENRTTAFKYPFNRKNVAFHCTQDGPSIAELRHIADEGRRPSILLMRLSSDAESQFRIIKARLARVGPGSPVAKVFPRVVDALNNAE